MALATDPALGATIKKRLNQNIEDQNPYGMGDPNTPLGRPAMSGIEKSLSAQAAGLNYDVNAERTARQNLLNQNVQTSEEKLARMYGLQPSGVVGSGQALRNFETLELGRAQQLDLLESELATKAPDQARQNISTLMGLQSNRESAALNAKTLNMQELGQAIGYEGQTEQLAQSEGALTGMYGGKQTEASRQFYVQQSGDLNGQSTLAGKALTEEQRRNKAQESLQSRGIDITEKSLGEEVRRNQAQESLQSRGVAVTEGSLREEIRRNQSIEALQSRGVVVTEKSLNEEIRRNQAQESLQSRGVAVTEQSLGEEIRKNKAQEVIQSTSLTEDQRRNKAIEVLQSRGLDINDKSVNAEIKLQTEKSALEQEQLYGGKLDKDGKFVPTLQSQQMTAEQKLNYQKLSIESRAQRDSAEAMWSQISGVTPNKPGAISQSEFVQAFEDSKAGKPFDPAADLNGDGKVDHDDLYEGASSKLIVPDDQINVPTLAAKQLQANVKTAADTLKLDEKKLVDTLAFQRDELKQSASQFASTFSGYLLDNNQNPIQKTVWNGFTWETQGLSSIDQQKFNLGRQQFNETMQQNAQQFAETMKLDWAKLTMEEKISIMQIQQASRNSMMQTVAAGIGAVGSILGKVL